MLPHGRCLGGHAPYGCTAAGLTAALLQVSVACTIVGVSGGDKADLTLMRLAGADPTQQGS